MEKKIIRFEGHNIIPQYMRSGEHWRIVIDVSDDQIENIKDVVLKRMPKGVYTIFIEPKGEKL